MGTAWRFVTVATLILSAAEEISAQITSIRVRSEDPTITVLIARASEWSTTFRSFLDTIGQSDGIVYVERGRCRHGGAACTAMNVALAGPNRILRIVIDPRRAGCDLNLMSSLGHELWHAIEILREPSLRSYADLYSFYSRYGRHTDRVGSIGAWETPEAIKAGFAVFGELQARVPEQAKTCRSG